MSNISQNEARRLRRRVEQLEQLIRSQRSRYGLSYPGGVNIASWTHPVDGSLATTIRTARILGHAVIVVEDGGQLRYYALPHPEVTP